MLQMPQEQVAQLFAMGQGGILFEMQTAANTQFVFCAYSHLEGSAAVVYLAEREAQKQQRTFFVCPIKHQFTAPTSSSLVPLGVLLHPDGVMALYEIRANNLSN